MIPNAIRNTAAPFMSPPRNKGRTYVIIRYVDSRYILLSSWMT
jgi:hypothetical protein